MQRSKVKKNTKVRNDHSMVDENNYMYSAIINPYRTTKSSSFLDQILDLTDFA